MEQRHNDTIVQWKSETLILSLGGTVEYIDTIVREWSISTGGEGGRGGRGGQKGGWVTMFSACPMGHGWMFTVKNNNYSL